MRLLIPFLLILSAGCAGPAGGDAAEAVREVMAANAAKDAAMIRRDAAALGALHADDYQIIDDDGAVHGRANQIEFMTTSVQLLEARSDEVRVSMLAPDVALLSGRMTGRYRMGRREEDFVERYTGVWVRQSGRWRVRHEHASMVEGGD